MFRPEEYNILDNQFKLLLHQGAIEPTYHSSPEFISNIFFTVITNGLSSGPRIFTKLLKPVNAVLRERGHVISGYIDDSFLMGLSFDTCLSNIQDANNLMKSLGFHMNYAKYVMVPTQRLEHLGFILDSRRMTVTLTARKVDNLIGKCKAILLHTTVKIRNVAELIGILVSSFTAVQFGPLHYRAIDYDKYKR